jgi:hypothetical protein
MTRGFFPFRLIFVLLFYAVSCTLPSLVLIMLYQQDIMDASGVALVLIGPGNIDQVHGIFCILLTS